jgi:DNA-binding NtrC family response regulator
MKISPEGCSGNVKMLPVLVLEADLDLRSVIVDALHRAHLSCDSTATAAAALLKIRDGGDYSYIVVDVDAEDDMRPLVDACAHDPALLAKVVVISDGDATPLVMARQPQLVKPFDAKQLLAPLRA